VARPVTRLAHVVLVHLVLTGCAGPSTAADHCSAGENATCVGAGACLGERSCAADGQFGACVCNGLDAGADAGIASTDASGDAGPLGPPDDAGLDAEPGAGPDAAPEPTGCDGGADGCCSPCADAGVEVDAGDGCADDGDPCNGAEMLDAMGVCVHGPPLDCDDRNGCTDDTCTAGTCAHAPLTGTACGPTTPGACAAGACVPCGGMSQPCCPSGRACRAAYTTCRSATTTCECGGSLEPCCAGTTCTDPELICSGLPAICVH